MTSLEKAERLVATNDCSSFGCEEGEVCPGFRTKDCIEACRAYIAEQMVQPKWHDERILEDANNEIASLKADNARLMDALSMIIDFAHDYSLDYCEKWGNYRQEVQANIKARVAHAKSVLEAKLEVIKEQK